jgi:phosphate transport system substrate-binding protein
MKYAISKVCIPVLAIACVLSSVHGASDQSHIVVVKGSNSMAPYVDRLAQAFMKKHPDISVVVSGGGTDDALEDLLTGVADVVMATSRLESTARETAKSQNLVLQERFFGWDAVVVVVNPQNPVSRLTLDQAVGVFSGEIRNWSAVGGQSLAIDVYVGDVQSSDTSAFFQDYVMKSGSYADTAQVRRYDRNVVKGVSKNPAGIGLAPFFKLLRDRSAYPVNSVAIAKDDGKEAVPPNEQTLGDRTYPLLRPLYLVWRGPEPVQSVRDFVDYCAVYGLAGKAALPEE